MPYISLTPVTYIGFGLVILALGVLISEYELKRQRRQRRAKLRKRAHKAVPGGKKWDYSN